mgnify:CR=1 FL=1
MPCGKTRYDWKLIKDNDNQLVNPSRVRLRWTRRKDHGVNLLHKIVLFFGMISMFFMVGD